MNAHKLWYVLEFLNGWNTCKLYIVCTKEVKKYIIQAWLVRFDNVSFPNLLKPTERSFLSLLSSYQHRFILCNVYFICTLMYKTNQPNPDVQTWINQACIMYFWTSLVTTQNFGLATITKMVSINRYQIELCIIHIMCQLSVNWNQYHNQQTTITREKFSRQNKTTTTEPYRFYFVRGEWSKESCPLNLHCTCTNLLKS